MLPLSLVAILMFALMPISVVRAQEKIFKVTIIAPGNANLVRRQWGQIFANSLQQLGIDARVIFLGWAAVYDRVMTPPPEIVGKTWDQGGFDIQLIGWTPGLIPEPRQTYYGGDPAFFAPSGQNYYLWNNSKSNELLDTFITSTDPAVQNASLQEWQSVYFEDVPASQIFYDERPAVVNPDLKGYDWIYFNVQCNPEYLEGKTEVVYASTGEIESLIPPLSNSWYDTIITTPIFNGLAQVNNQKETIPALFTDWTPSNNGFTWTFQLRTGVKWHDGNAFSADDVVFSLWALLNTDAGSQFVGYYQSVYGNNVTFKYENGTAKTLGDGDRVGNITAVDADTVVVNLPTLAAGKPYGYFDPYLLAFANNIIPIHIFEKIPPAQWTTSVFNTGEGTQAIGGITYKGPIGTGPYKWVEFDPTAQLVHLKKFNDYWNKTALEAEGRFEVEDYYIKFIADKTAALASLKNKQVDMLDPNYQMHTEAITAGAIDPAWSTIFNLEGAGRQEIGYNMRHPIFGTGVDTPLGKSNSARAAEAARYVRTAFDYAVPRQLIIDNLLSGFGQPGVTPMLPTQPYYNSSLTARPYDLAKAREFLEKAGYTVPGPAGAAGPPVFILGMSTVISGYYTDSDGNPLPNRELSLMETANNATYNTTSVILGRTTTDISGFYSFTVTPTSTGTFYYYLFDSQAPAGTEFKYVRSIQVTSLSEQLMPLQALSVIALVVAIVFGFANLYMIRKKRS